MNDQRTFVAVFDIKALLGAPRIAGTHTVNPAVNLVTTGVVSFAPVQ
jgi:hypothetical protein